jgi:hypothetical protein
MWVFLLPSAWFPLKLAVEKTSLSIAHGSTQAMAQLESGTTGLNGENILKAYVTSRGGGMKNVQVTLDRELGRTKMEDVIGEVGASGMEPFSRKPFMRNLNVVLVAPSNMYIHQFVGFLKYLGADAKASFFSLEDYMPSLLFCSATDQPWTTRCVCGAKNTSLGMKKTKLELALHPKRWRF